jgi:hypothetical protein
MSEIQCTNCGSRFDRAAADFCPAPGCGFPVEFMADAPQPDDVPPREDILRRPDEDDTDGDEATEPPPAVDRPPPDADAPPPPVSTPTPVAAPRPRADPPPADDAPLFDERARADAVGGTAEAEDVEEDDGPMLPKMDGGRRIPVALLVVGVALAAVVGLGLVRLLSGGVEEVEAAATGGGDSAGTREGADGSGVPPRGSGGDGPSQPPDNGQNGGNGNDQPPDPQPTDVPDVVGLEFGEAQVIVAAAGLEVAAVEQESADAPPGTVMQQDPVAGATVEPGATVTLAVAQPPAQGADLSLALAECQLILGGAPTGADALNLLVHTLNEGTTQVPGAVVVEVVAGGLSNRVNAPITGPGSVVVPFLELREGDYTGPTEVALTIDPDDAIPETRRDNNTLSIRVELPSERPQQNRVPLPCRTR